MTKIARLTNRMLIRLTGDDVVDFLQNLITCDVSGLEVGQSSFGALLSPQGKILYEFFVQRQAKGYLIDCAMSGRDELAKKLQFYKLRADVRRHCA